MYRIKQIPEDFIVKEIASLEPLDKGEYGIFWLKKKEVSTLKAAEWIADFFKIPLKNVGFGGAKDKQAETEQTISIRDIGKKGEKASNKFMQLKFLGYADKPVSLGDLEGNDFKITVRNLDKERPAIVKQIINYFDNQRFSKNNHLIGKAIIKRDFKKACALLSDEKEVRHSLEEHPSDFVRAIKTIPLKTRMIYVHAYQSWLFNRTVESFLKKRFKENDFLRADYSLGTFLFPNKDIENMRIPLIGFDIEECDARIKEIIDDIMEKESITERDFVIREMPELSSEGGFRDMVVPVMDLAIEKDAEDELNKGKKKMRIMFRLQKGSYATIAIKRMFAES